MVYFIPQIILHTPVSYTHLGSGGGAHAAMVAATSDNSDYFPYEVEAGAVGIYQNEDEMCIRDRGGGTKV